MRRRTKAIAAAAALGMLVAASAGIAAANNHDSDDANEADAPIVASDLQRASEAALGYIGEGRATETEVGDEESYYEVEVTLDDGSQVDVQLDESFVVVGGERESHTNDD